VWDAGTTFAEPAAVDTTRGKASERKKESLAKSVLTQEGADPALIVAEDIVDRGTYLRPDQKISENLQSPSSVNLRMKKRKRASRDLKRKGGASSFMRNRAEVKRPCPRIPSGEERGGPSKGEEKATRTGGLFGKKTTKVP